MFKAFLRRLRSELRSELREMELIPVGSTRETTIRVYVDTHEALKLIQRRLEARSLDMVIRMLIRADVPLDVLAEAARACSQATPARRTVEARG
jgi:hypothetical protein